MEQAERDRLGVDCQGRLHGAVATDMLMDTLHEHAEHWPGGKVVNHWGAADAAVAATTDEEIREAALRNLLALHSHELEHDEPQVAMRNVRVGDYVRLHGAKSYVREVLDNAPSRSPKRAITLKVNYHSPDGPEATYAYDAYVRIPLIARCP